MTQPPKEIQDLYDGHNPAALLAIANDMPFEWDFGRFNSALFRLRDPDLLAEVLRLQVSHFPQSSAKSAQKRWMHEPWQSLAFHLAGLPMDEVIHPSLSTWAGDMITDHYSSAHELMVLRAHLGTLEDLLQRRNNAINEIPCIRDYHKGHV